MFSRYQAKTAARGDYFPTESASRLKRHLPPFFALVRLLIAPFQPVRARSRRQVSDRPEKDVASCRVSHGLTASTGAGSAARRVSARMVAKACGSAAGGGGTNESFGDGGSGPKLANSCRVGTVSDLARYVGVSISRLRASTSARLNIPVFPFRPWTYPTARRRFAT